MKQERAMMKCGHASNASTSDGNPCCAICAGGTGWNTVATSPNLEDRKSICLSCKRIVASNLDLAFFEYRPDKELDAYYCGCKGWN